MGISQYTHIWWERDRYLPRDSHWKPIVKFLGYYPILEPISELNWILAVRRQLDLSKSKFSRNLNIDEATYVKIENRYRMARSLEAHDTIILFLDDL